MMTTDCDRERKERCEILDNFTTDGTKKSAL